MKYSLEFLAWVNRCLFPDDFERDLIELGVGPFMAMAYAELVRRQGKDILGVYQTYISSKESQEHIEMYLQMMMDKWNSYKKV